MGMLKPSPMATNSGPRHGQVVIVGDNSAAPGPGSLFRKAGSSFKEDSHEYVTCTRMAERLAALKQFEFAGTYSDTANYDALYYVPLSTLLQEDALALGIQRADQLFGGCVPEPFVGTKSITHALIGGNAVAPAGWSEDFAAAVKSVVLSGHTAFSEQDAYHAAIALLRDGSVRLKPALGIGGSGQTVIRDLGDLNAALSGIDRIELARYGLVIEQNLDDVETFSVGQVDVADMTISYHGEQHLTTNHSGHQVYGGSRLHVVRGDLNALAATPVAPPLKIAIGQAARYDHAANQYFAGLIASRRNYDVAQGVDNFGRRRSGVLEQSWRIGGASPAEITALEAFAADPNLHSVDVSTHELYSVDLPSVPANIHYRGIDARVGALVKYCTVDAYGYSSH